jgi:NIPSNAP
MLYDVSTITLQPGSTPQGLGKLEAKLAAGAFRGELLACWISDIGALNQILMIRAYPEKDLLEADRLATTMRSDLLGIGEFIAVSSMETYAPFPFLEPMRPGRTGAFYEVRTYMLKPDALSFTIEAWRKALPDRVKLSPLLIAMHTLTGATPKFMHIWPYNDLDERHRIRTRAVETGVWPPPGGPGRLISQQTDIYVPARFSPV